jgi:uncharacterized membrane protein
MKVKIYLVAAAISALAMLVVILGLPETVPIHFGYAGDADQWGSRWFYLVFACIPLAELGSYLLYRRFSHSQNVQKNAAYEEKVVAMTGLFLAAVGWFFLMQVKLGATKLNTSWACLILTGVGLIMIYVSNFMAKLRPNHTMGFRVRWTMKDETVWVKAHRVAGYAGVVGGAVIVAASLLGMVYAVWIALTGFGLGMLILTAWPTIYARNLYNRLHPEEK